MLEEYIRVYAKNAGFPEDFLPEICDASIDGGIYSINFAGIFVSLIPCTFEDKSYVKAVIAVKEIKDEDLCEVFNLQRKLKFLSLPVRPVLYIESKEKILSILVFLPLDDLKETAFLNFMDALESLALFTANGKAVYQNYRDLDLKKNHAKLLNFLSAAGVNYYDLRANFMRLPTSEGSTLVGLDAALNNAVAKGYCDWKDIKVIGIRHGEKMYETLLTNEECANAIDMGNFYRVPCDKRGLNYDKYFTKGNTERNKLSEFNSNNTQLLTVEETKEKIASLAYIQEELAKDGLK